MVRYTQISLTPKRQPVDLSMLSVDYIKGVIIALKFK